MKKNIIKYPRIRDLRENKGLTQKALASYLAVPQNTYSQYELGKHKVPIGILVKIAYFYETSVDYLMGRTDEFKPYPRKQSF